MKTHEEALQLAKKMMQAFHPYHRGLHTITRCGHASYIQCIEIHVNKLAQQILAQQPIIWVLPAFPAKSPNTNKTVGPLPDLGERLALRFLQEMCDRIQALYEPGAKMVICSDGRVFNDLVKVHDDNVDAYMEGINRIIEEDKLTHITTFGLDHYYEKTPYPMMREQLVHEHGEPISVIKNKIKVIDAEKMLFNGIHRFIFEDHLVLLHALSRNQVRKVTKETAYYVIQRSNAWGQLVKAHFPHAIRLSIHPQACGSEKMGIMLLKSKDVWATPWHRVVLFDGKEHSLIRKHEAEALGAKPIFNNNQFSHYRVD